MSVRILKPEDNKIVHSYVALLKSAINELRPFYNEQTLQEAIDEYTEDYVTRNISPNSEVVDRITNYLGSRGRLDYDGRPIFGISCRDLVKDLKEIDDKIEIVPAHCMTPWFGLFGSKSGFDSLKDCFGDQAKKVYAVESGMSADPSMLWRFEELANSNVRVVSFSDAHSFWPWRIGREATIFDIPELSYDNIVKAIRTGKGLKATIETIKKQVNVLVKEYNSLITNYSITQERIQLAQSNYNAMMSHIAIGGTLDVMEMVEILDNLYASKILLLSYKFRFSDLVEKLKRITFTGDYALGPKTIEKFVIVEDRPSANEQNNNCDPDFDWNCEEEF